MPVSPQAMTVAGLYFVLYHQAGIEMEISTRQTLSCLERGNTFDSEAFCDDVLMPGVILRVIDDSGRVLYDNAAHFPPLREVQRHATNEGCCSWAEFAREIFRQSGRTVQVVSVDSSAYPTRAVRPKNSRMSKACLERAGFSRLPSWQDALGRYLQELAGMRSE